MWHLIHINELLILVLSCGCLKKATTQETQSFSFWLLIQEFLSLEGCSHIWPQIHLQHIVQQGRDKPLLWELTSPTLVFWWHSSPATRGIMHGVEQDSSVQASYRSGSWLLFWKHQTLQDYGLTFSMWVSVKETTQQQMQQLAQQGSSHLLPAHS